MQIANSMLIYSEISLARNIDDDPPVSALKLPPRLDGVDIYESRSGSRGGFQVS